MIFQELSRADANAIIRRARDLARDPSSSVRDLKGTVKGLLNVIANLEDSILRLERQSSQQVATAMPHDGPTTIR